jgi:hypothetical protein
VYQQIADWVVLYISNQERVKNDERAAPAAEMFEITTLEWCGAQQSTVQPVCVIQTNERLIFIGACTPNQHLWTTGSLRVERVKPHHALLIKVNGICLPELAVKEWNPCYCLHHIAPGMTFCMEKAKNLADKSSVAEIRVAHDHLGATNGELYSCVIHLLSKQNSSRNDDIMLIYNHRNIMCSDQRMSINPFCNGIGIDCS